MFSNGLETLRESEKKFLSRDLALLFVSQTYRF